MLWQSVCDANVYGVIDLLKRSQQRAAHEALGIQYLHGGRTICLATNYSTEQHVHQEMS